MSTSMSHRLLRQLLPACALAGFSSLTTETAARAEISAPFLVADFDSGSYLAGSEPRGVTVADGRIFYLGRDVAHGDEPWISDGSAAGTRRLADLCPGPCSTYGGGFVELGGAVVFYGNGDDGGKVFRFAEGETHEIAAFDDSLLRWTPLGSLAFFATRDNQLWRTDGTRAGTFQVGEFHRVPSYEEPPEMAAVNGAIYFADSGGLQRLTEDGDVRQVMSLGGSPGAIATRFAALDAQRFLFTGCASTAIPCQVYVSDGTSAGTRSLAPTPGGDPNFETLYFIWRGRAYFEIRPPGAYEPIVVSTDGTAAGTRQETAFPPSSYLFAVNAAHLFYVRNGALHALDAHGQSVQLAGGDAGYFKRIGLLGERLVFTYGDVGGIARPGYSRVASSDGTAAGTRELFDGGGEAGAVLGGLLYFAGSAATTPGGARSGLWRSDGSAAGTFEVEEPARAPFSSSPRIYSLGSVLIAEASDDVQYENPRLYRIDPATLESARVGEEPSTVAAAGGGRAFLTSSPYYDADTYAYDGQERVRLPLPGRPSAGAVAGDGHYFFFTDVAPGQQLWKSDGSAAGTRLLHDFAPHTRPCDYGYCGYHATLAISGDHVYFAASGDGQRLSVWDRATGQKRTVRETPDSLQLLLPMPGGALVFNQGTYFSNMSLWKSDGTAAGTAPFHQIQEPTNLMRLFEMGGKLYFGLDPGDAGPEVLWTSDLTAEGTRPVAPLGKLDFVAAAVAGGRFFFSTDNGAGRELGVTDGTAAGTRFIDLRPGPEGSYPDSFFALGDGRLVFAASADAAGNELWISDGSNLGTYRLTDLNPGAAASSPSDFVQVGNRLFFRATDGITGFELWGLDLPPAGVAPCPAGRVCLGGGRFEISLVAHAPDGDFPAQKEVGNASSAVYSFFSPGNWEMLLKVLDGCAINGNYWVYAAAATDAGWTLRIVDRETGAERVYGNDPGQASRAITDAGAFSCGGALALPGAEAYNPLATF